MILVSIISVIAGLSIGYYAAKKITSGKKLSQMVSLDPGAIIDLGHARKTVRTEPDTHEKVLKYYGISDEELIRTGGKFWMSQNAGTTVLPVKDLLPDCAESISGKARIIINYDPDFDYYIVRLDESYTP